MSMQFKITRVEYFQIRGGQEFILIGAIEDGKYCLGIEGKGFDVERIYTEDKEAAQAGFEMLFSKLASLADKYDAKTDTYIFFDNVKVESFIETEFLNFSF